MPPFTYALWIQCCSVQEKYNHFRSPQYAAKAAAPLRAGGFTVEFYLLTSVHFIRICLTVT